MIVLQVSQGFGPGPYQLSQRKYTRDDLKYGYVEKVVSNSNIPPWGYTWYEEDNDGNLSIYKTNWDTSG